LILLDFIRSITIDQRETTKIGILINIILFCQEISLLFCWHPHERQAVCGTSGAVTQAPEAMDYRSGCYLYDNYIIFHHLLQHSVGENHFRAFGTHIAKRPPDGKGALS
jgi:hypothetical protein